MFDQSERLSLAVWALGIAKFFGFWPFTTNITHTKQLNSMKINRNSRFRLAIIFPIYLFCIWFQCTAHSFESLDFSAIESMINRFTVISTGLISILNILMNIRNRNRLWKIIITNHEFDKKVSPSPLLRAVFCFKIAENHFITDGRVWLRHRSASTQKAISPIAARCGRRNMQPNIGVLCIIASSTGR